MDKNKNAEENLKSVSYFIQGREERLLGDIKDESEFFGGREEAIRKKCDADIEDFKRETKREREALNEIKDLARELRDLAQGEKINSKSLFSSPVINPDCERCTRALTDRAQSLSTQEVKDASLSLCTLVSDVAKGKIEKSLYNEIAEKAKEVESLCQRDSIEKELEYRIAQREAERDQRLKQIRENISASIERSVELYMGYLRLEVLGEKYANGEPPRVRSTK